MKGSRRQQQTRQQQQEGRKGRLQQQQARRQTLTAMKKVGVMQATCGCSCLSVSTLSVNACGLLLLAVLVMQGAGAAGWLCERHLPLIVFSWGGRGVAGKSCSTALQSPASAT